MPTTSFDTFFACTILVAVALIATAFLGQTMQARIESTQDINKDSFLKAIADHIVTSPGMPIDWGTSSDIPQAFGLAQSQSQIPYEINMDKIGRLNSKNNGSLSYPEIVNAAKLNNLALGIRVSQMLSIGIEQSENHTSDDQTSFTFTLTTDIDSKPVDASLHCYIIAKNYFTDLTDNTSNGKSNFTVQIPSAETYNALLVVFSRASFDSRVTSYAVYSFSDSAQQSSPSDRVVALSAINYTLSFMPRSLDVEVQKGYLLSYTYQSNITAPSSTGNPIPKAIDNSPFIIILCGQNGTNYFQEWTAYPQVPLYAGSNFENSEQTIFSYIVNIKDSLYKLDLSFGGMAN